MKDLKILILLTYYERPIMVKNALNSILNNNETYKNWELAFIDDGSIKKGRPIAEEILKDHLDKVKFYDINATIEDKIKWGGSFIGKYLNEAIKESDADVCVFLMDDDFLFSDCFFNINAWFNRNSDEPYCCANTIRHYVSTNKVEIWNAFNKERNKMVPFMQAISWKIECNKSGNVWFPFPETMALDGLFVKSLYDIYGIPKISQHGDFFHFCKVEHNYNLSNIPDRINLRREHYVGIGDIMYDIDYILKKQYDNPILNDSLNLKN